MLRAVKAGAICMLLTGGAASAEAPAASTPPAAKAEPATPPAAPADPDLADLVIARSRGAKPDGTSALTPAEPTKWTEIGMTGLDAVWLMQMKDIYNRMVTKPQVWIRIDRSEEMPRKLSESRVL